MAITTTPSGGPQGEFSTYTPIYAQTLSAATASITFSNIPTTFTDLVLVVAGVAATGTTFPWMRFNGLSTSIYSDTQLYGNGSAAASARRTAQSRGYIAEQVETGTTQISNTIVHIMNYSNTTTYKTYLVRNNNGGTGSYVGTEAIVGLAQLTAPITSITVGIASGGVDYNLASGSTFTLYGIKAATTAPKATGGDVITTDGTYWYHAFLNSGIFDVKQAITCDYLVVAGGGGGGAGGGGGGAGGLRSTVTTTGGGGSLESALSLTAGTTFAVTVGSGGAGAPNSGTNVGTNGSNSTFSTITSTGGGGGGSSPGTQTGANGGSGGGSHNSTYSSGTVNQGYAGGIGAAGGGGGAGSVGQNGPNAPTYNGGNGGSGVTISALATATNTGVSSAYAGGGGGSGGGATTPGSASAGGGAGRNSTNIGYSGTANTGGGGGSGGTGPASTYIQYGGGDGGSGIVIVRYAL
jgi:hypothetical protein